MIIRHEKVKAGIIGWGKNTLLLADLLTRYAKNIELVALSIHLANPKPAEPQSLWWHRDLHQIERQVSAKRTELRCENLLWKVTHPLLMGR